MEVNLAMDIPNCEIVANPFNMKPTDAADWPDSDDGFSLACVGRLHFQSKGQDAVVHVMRQDKWRERAFA